jgi:hypothetical protein
VSTLAYRPQARRPARRRRRYRQYHLSRWATFGTGAAAPFAGWLYAVEPLHWVAPWMPWAILGAMVIAGEIIVPVSMLFTLFALPAIILGGPFRQQRIRHRMRHDRAQCKSAVITAGLRRLVLAMDRNRCLYCGISAAELALLPPRVNLDGVVTPRRVHVDHGMPWRAGGRTTPFNLGVLCDEHNEIKLNYWRERNGYVWYRPQCRTPERLAEAAEITRVVLSRRWGLFRMLRACWALG